MMTGICPVRSGRRRVVYLPSNLSSSPFIQTSMIEATSPHQINTPAEVALVFPPLVSTNFGTYYPSTAVLAAYLSTRGIRAIQEDLNELFALYLLEPAALERMAQADFGLAQPLPLNSMPAIAARVLSRHRDLLFDARGRHLFGECDSSLSYLLDALASPFWIDKPVSVLSQSSLDEWPVTKIYRDFYARSGFLASLPMSVETIGISVTMGPQLVPSLILAKAIKAARPDAAVVLGGPTLSLMPLPDLERLLASFETVDAIVRFDGEYPLAALLEQKREGRWEPAAIPGVSGRVKTAVKHCPPQAGPRLESLPFAEYDARLLSRLANPEIGIIQARGCYWGRCTYCDYVELYDGSPAFRTRTPQRFVEEMEYQIEKHGVRRFSIITESIPPSFARRLSDLILARGLDARWNSFAMVEKHFTAELLGRMRRAGCECLVIGLETMTDRVLKLVEKAGTQEENANFLRNARDAGMRLKVNLIPDLPSTTYPEALDSLAVLDGLRDCLHWVAIFPFEATRSSAIGREPARFGLKVSGENRRFGQAEYATNHLEVIDPAMTPEEREAIHTAFSDFAKEVNAEKNSPGTAKAGQLKVSDNASWHLADESLDYAQVDGQTQCYNWVTRRLFNVPTEWLQMVRRAQPFQRDEFVRQFEHAPVGEFIFNQFLTYELLVSN
jgi:hypothetical protein